MPTTKVPTIGGLIVREYNDSPSNFRYTKTLSEILEENGIPGIAGIDTRRLTRSIRDHGSRRGLITDADTPRALALEKIAATPVPHDAVATVSCKNRWYARTANPRFRVVAVDCGIKLNIIRSLNARGCDVTVVPYNTTAEEIAAMKPDGVFLSNGPGDPTDVTPVIALVRALRGRCPIFGICLGHQMIALAYGAETYKLTHRNLLDGTVEGIACPADRVFSVQYHPESAPGPQDSGYLFDAFIRLMKEEPNHAETH